MSTNLYPIFRGNDAPEVPRTESGGIPAGPLILADIRDVGREGWLALRKLGGSDAAAIMGESPYRGHTPYRLHAEKIGTLPARKPSEAMEIGSLLEDLTASLYASRTGHKVRKNYHLYQSREHPFMTATPDYVIDRLRDALTLLQIKTTSAYNADQWSDGVPRHVELQVQHEMYVTGAVHTVVACLIGGQRLVHFDVPRDEDTIAELIEAESAFWELVEKRIPPPLEAGDADTLSNQYPTSHPETIELRPDAMLFVEQYQAAKRDADDAEERKQRAANCLRAMLGSADEGRIGSYRVKWTTQERKEHVVKASTFRKFEVRQVKA